MKCLLVECCKPAHSYHGGDKWCKDSSNSARHGTNAQTSVPLKKTCLTPLEQWRSQRLPTVNIERTIQHAAFGSPDNRWVEFRGVDVGDVERRTDHQFSQKSQRRNAQQRPCEHKIKRRAAQDHRAHETSVWADSGRKLTAWSVFGHFGPLIEELVTYYTGETGQISKYNHSYGSQQDVETVRPSTVGSM